MEKALCLSVAQSEWHIRKLVKKGIIKRTRKKAPNKIGKGNPQIIYKYINKEF